MTDYRLRFHAGTLVALLALGCALYSMQVRAGTFDDLKQGLSQSLGEAAKRSLDAALGNPPSGNAAPASTAPTAPAQTQAPVSSQVATKTMPGSGSNPSASAQPSGQASSGCARRKLAGSQKEFRMFRGFMEMDVVNDCDGDLTLLTYQNYKTSQEVCNAAWVPAHSVKKMMPVARLCSTRMTLPKSSPYVVPCTCPDGTNIELTAMQQAN